MKPVLQTIFGRDNGNCFNACLASVLEIELSSIPYFMHDDNWIEKYNQWLIENFGVYVLDVSTETPETTLKGYHLIVGYNEISDCYHSQVGFNGKVVHDPLGEIHNLKNTSYTIFVKHIGENTEKRHGIPDSWIDGNGVYHTENL